MKGRPFPWCTDITKYLTSSYKAKHSSLCRLCSL
jgi:hypothetical protein